MATHVTPSKQAATSLENLKMSDSPIKKLDFESVGKENTPASFKPVDAPMEKPTEKALEAPKVAAGIKEAEANEPPPPGEPSSFCALPY
ncbi:hypothetical protein N7462_004600 [Penicillium macrosclerotiorum]|uniref:uncharacterized protein n=1 Tax=Penicillium macrosclerotiorum TaxID=303699 RepID=UPI00254798B9|nr:uncharacterized protein N7462_004600 [Penicillium macrosclerotiorum]KAJ5690208.1 hypothetical protein N7462_004600 [Penicillium macrosclerotiorum]